jgi:hypothetical protein
VVGPQEVADVDEPLAQPALQRPDLAGGEPGGTAEDLVSCYACLGAGGVSAAAQPLSPTALLRKFDGEVPGAVPGIGQLRTEAAAAATGRGVDAAAAFEQVLVVVFGRAD